MTLGPARRKGRQFQNPVPTAVGGLSLMFKIGPRFFFGAKTRSPKGPLGPFRTDPEIYTTPPASGLRVTWFGHASSLLEIDGLRILIDPVWDERASPTSWSGPKRFFAPTLRLDELPPLDAIVISHDHYDHLGEQTVRALVPLAIARDAVWITPVGVAAILSGMGVDRGRIREVNWMDTVQVGTRGSSVQLTALPSRHFSGRSLFNRFQTLWASFAITGPRHNVYYGADSGEWDGFHEIGERFGPFDLSMLEIGAFDELWASVHMGPQGALRSFQALGGKGLLMPIHWGLFDLALHHWKQPIEAVFAAQDVKLWSPEPGQPREVIAGQQLRSDWWAAHE